MQHGMAEARSAEVRDATATAKAVSRASKYGLAGGVDAWTLGFRELAEVIYDVHR